MDPSPARIRPSKKGIQDLLKGLSQGGGETLANLLNLYRPYLLATAKARLEDRLKPKAGASDLVQETLAEAHRAWQRLDRKPQTEEEFRIWLRNILLDRLKTLRRRYYRAKSRSLRRECSLDDGESKRLIEQLAGPDTETPSARFEREALTKRLQQAIDRLPAAYRQVILWRSRDGWQFAEIGERLNRSADAARMLWSRAIRLLKKELGVEDGDG